MSSVTMHLPADIGKATLRIFIPIVHFINLLVDHFMLLDTDA